MLFLCMITDTIPTGRQRLYNVSFLRYVIYERSHIVATAFVNERCFTYVQLTLVKRFQRTSNILLPKR